MKNPNLSAESERRPAYLLGLVSLLLSLAPYLFLFIQILFILGIPWHDLRYSPQAFGIECLACSGTLLSIAGIILGIVSLVRKEPKKYLSIAGIVLGILGPVPVIAVGWFSGILFFSPI